MRLLPALDRAVSMAPREQLDEREAAAIRYGLREHETRHASPEDINHIKRRERVYRWHAAQTPRWRQRVTRQVEVHTNPVASEVEDIGRARAIDVRKTNALGVEMVG